ncbi:MAG: sulfurtransferase complex subunit TusD [Gammaproteobacteria bacterium]
MKFAILVNGGPFTQQAAATAYHFTRAALEKGHEVSRVFFYHDAVQTGTRLNVPPQDECDLPGLWRELGARYRLDLVVCVSAAQRRGVLDAREAQRHGKDSDNLAPGFRIGGLGQLIEAGIDAERLVAFGA